MISSNDLIVLVRATYAIRSRHMNLQTRLEAHYAVSRNFLHYRTKFLVYIIIFVLIAGSKGKGGFEKIYCAYFTSFYHKIFSDSHVYFFLWHTLHQNIHYSTLLVYYSLVIIEKLHVLYIFMNKNFSYDFLTLYEII